MKLLRLSATFGCLDKAVLDLSDGLNLLEMPNESGKSTWCAFLRAMFYGLESRKGGALSERNRYTPWSGAPMAGTVDLIWRDRAITLRRFAKGQSPFGGFQAVYTGTEEPVAGLTADNVGPTILGVTKEVFQRTCFIPQGALGIDASGELERRIAALASAGEEDTSYSDAESRLRDWRNQRQSNRATGTIPKLRARLLEVQLQRQRLLDARQRGQEAQAALRQLESDRQAVQADLARHARQAETERLAAHRARCEAAGERLARAEDALAQADAAQAAARQAVPPQPGSGLGGRLALGLCLILGCALVLCAILLRLWPLMIGGAALLNIGALGTHLLTRNLRAARAGYEAALTRCREAQQALTAAQTEAAAAQAAWEATVAQEAPSAPTGSVDPPQKDLAWDQAQLARVQSAITSLTDQLSRSRGEEAALGGLAPLEEEIAELTRRLAKEEGELAALNLALDVLADANAQLTQTFSPALNAKAGALLDRLTGGRYTALSFTREFDALAQSPYGPKSAQLLSQGTADQTYLALRLAICLLALPGPEAAPLVLDDALVTFDDRRLVLALEVLQDLARERQILLFTCQSRERTILG